MRLITSLIRRTVGRVSAGRRSRMAAPLVLLLGLLVTGGMYAALSPATAQTQTADEDMVAKGQALFLVGCASCHGKNAEGISTSKGDQYGPSLVGVGAAAVDFQVGTGRMPMAQPGGQALRKPPVYDAGGDRGAGGVRRLARPRPRRARRVRLRRLRRRPTRTSSAVASSSAPTARRATTSPAAGGALPRGRFAPTLDGRLREAHLRGHAHRPAADAGLLRRGAHPRGQAADHRLPEEERGDARPTAASRSARSVPVSEGLFAWIVGIGALVGFAVWIAANPARSTRKKARRHERQARARQPIETEPIADPGLPEHQPRPTDVDERLEKRAERQVATLFGLSTVFTLLFCVSYFVFDVGDDPSVILGCGASNVALGLCLGLALLCIGVGTIQWARKLMSDHEIVEYRHPALVLRRGPRGDAGRPASRAPRSPASAVAR